MATAILTTPRHQTGRHLASIAGFIAAGALAGAAVTMVVVDSDDATGGTTSRARSATSAPASADALERRLAEPVVVEARPSLPASADAAEQWVLNAQAEPATLPVSGPR